MKNRKVTYLSDLHFDHNQWNSEISFWEYEMKYFEQELSELIQNMRFKKFLPKLEHFQNLFAVHREEMSILKHKINRHEELLAQVAKRLPSEIEHKHFTDHAALRERMDRQRDLFREMKEEFFQFLDQHLAETSKV